VNGSGEVLVVVEGVLVSGGLSLSEEEVRSVNMVGVSGVLVSRGLVFVEGEIVSVDGVRLEVV
jgi:uncharacterized protein related to proFAR isomerase